VPYREELEASLARTAAVEEELAAARSENAHDHERIAGLEKQLEEARRDGAAQAPPNPPTPQPVRSTPPTLWQRLGWGALVPLVIVSVVVSDELYKAVVRKKNTTVALTEDVSTTRLDVMAEVVRAKAGARKLIPDAALVQIGTQSIVDSRGYADLTQGFVTFDFYAPSKQHYIHVTTHAGSRQVMDFTSGSGLRIPDPPRCSVVDVWAEAIRRGAAPSALASLHLGMTNDGPVWSFQLEPPNTFVMTLPDECPITH
jgi:hypothetical protein